MITSSKTTLMQISKAAYCWKIEKKYPELSNTCNKLCQPYVNFCCGRGVYFSLQMRNHLHGKILNAAQWHQMIWVNIDSGNGLLPKGKDKIAAILQWHFQMHFLERISLDFDSNFIELCSCEVQLTRGHHCFRSWLGAYRWQAMISINDGLDYWRIDASLRLYELTHWGRDLMDANSQTTFSSALYWMKMFKFRLKFHWRLFLRVQLTIFQNRFR